MNNKEFIAELAHRSGYKQNDTRRLVQSFIDALAPATGPRYRLQKVIDRRER